MIQQFHFYKYIQRNKNTNWERYLLFHVHWGTIYNSQDMETILSVHRWIMDK